SRGRGVVGGGAGSAVGRPRQGASRVRRISEEDGPGHPDDRPGEGRRLTRAPEPGPPVPPAPNFDDAVVVRAPERSEPGYWAGAAGVLVDGRADWLACRERAHQR